MCKTDLRHFRILSGTARRLAVRAHLTTHHGVNWTGCHTDLTRAQRAALEDMAKAVSWRKGIGSPLTLASAFFVYLAREVQPASVVRGVPAARMPFNYGRGAP